MRKIFSFIALALMTLLALPMYAGSRYSITSHYQLLRALRTGKIDASVDGEGTYDLSAEDVLVLQNDIIWEQDVNPDSRNSDLLVVVNRAVDTYTIDLNGHTLQRNISEPTSDESVSVISFAKRESSLPVTLVIKDSQGGGQVIADMPIKPSSGYYPSAVIFPSNCPGKCAVHVYGGALQGRVTGKKMSGSAGVLDRFGCVTKIYGGELDGYSSLANNTNSQLELYGGVLGNEYNLSSTAQGAMYVLKGLDASSVWEGGVVYGIKYAKDNLFFAFHISAMSYAYLNGQKSSVVDLNALSYEERDRSKIEIEHIWMLDIDHKEVTTRSKDDVLGDGKVRFEPDAEDRESGTLYLNGATLSEITNHIPLTIVLSGANTLNGQLISYGSNIEILSADNRIPGLAAKHKLTVNYSTNDTPVLLYDGNLTVKDGVGLNVKSNGYKYAVECDKFTLQRCWFKASATTGPVVFSASNNLIDEQLVSGSLTGKNVEYKPNYISAELYILGQELTEYDYDTDIELDGIVGKVHFSTNGLELENAIIDARGRNIETIKGKLKKLTYRGNCYIVNDNKPALDLSGVLQTLIEQADYNEKAHLYIISGTYGIQLADENQLRLGNRNNGCGTVSIYGDSYGIKGDNTKPSLFIFDDTDISGGVNGLPVYNVSIGSTCLRVSDFGGWTGFNEQDGVFISSDNKNADHVVFRRNGPNYQAGKSYPIEVAGVMVTDGNAPDVLGDGKVAYDTETSTLTFKNASINGFYVPAVRVRLGTYALSDLNIKLQGTTYMQSSAPNGAIYIQQINLNIDGTETDSLIAQGYGMMGINRVTKYKQTAITGGCYVKAVCYNNNYIQSGRSAALQSDKLRISNSTLYAENRSTDPTNKVSLYSYDDSGNPGLILEGVEIVEGQPNTPEPILIAPVGDGIEDIRVEGDKPLKILHEGHVYIFRGTKAYDVTGAEIR